ncbi:AraC family transcriptional regulator [Bradyrhizobium sp. Arg237L]|uniref:helix-turn-helix transcriptional regulator n=1 Tax=Bradyrhizobium sp. Arg237L TaxID=3003352 RepID=UPI00249DEB2D|nr:AraC family transcriptional regulator [Bradyrhizobium sp. Arg237L]MDI4238435.1 AraC family transcriptional regulator [Bradyrhizobium sp. Arg237L]
MLSFTTDDVDPEHRFDHWREVRGKSLFGVTIELPTERRADFQGRFSAIDIGGAIVSRMHASSYRVSRTSGDIARMPADSLCIAWQTRGAGWMDVGRGRGHRVADGDIVINHSDTPFEGTPERSDGFDFLMLKIPLGRDVLLGAPAHDLFAATLLQKSPFFRALSALFHALTQEPRGVADASAEITHIARLAMLARGRLLPGMPECRAALRSGFYYAARDILVRDLHQPGLSPAQVAQELGISLRQVHVLFEPTGLSFSRTLAALRVRKAGELLAMAPSRPVADVAYACGFDSLATFYRAFRNYYGMTPRDMRVHANCE